jgi:hypothetical protein
MKTTNLMIAIWITTVACLCFVEGCASPLNCADRACATAQVAMQDTCVLIACGYYDPAPLERPGAPHVECLRWWNGRWEFCCLDGDEFKSKGTAIYGFEIERYYMYDEFIAKKDNWETGQGG